MAGMQKENLPKSKANQLIARGAFTVMAAFIVSNLVGLLAKTMTARHFGTGVDSNAFLQPIDFLKFFSILLPGELWGLLLFRYSQGYWQKMKIRKHGD